MFVCRTLRTALAGLALVAWLVVGCDSGSTPGVGDGGADS